MHSPIPTINIDPTKPTHSDETTEMNRAHVVIGCRSITHPGGFHYGKFLAEHTLLFVYAMCYSCLAPLILPAGFGESMFRACAVSAHVYGPKGRISSTESSSQRKYYYYIHTQSSSRALTSSTSGSSSSSTSRSTRRAVRLSLTCCVIGCIV